MPQINPSPWLYILTMVWSVFLLLLFPMVIVHTYPQKFSMHVIMAPKPKSWNWPW